MKQEETLAKNDFDKDAANWKCPKCGKVQPNITYFTPKDSEVLSRICGYADCDYFNDESGD